MRAAREREGEQLPPIMVGDVNVRPFSRNELIELNKYYLDNISNTRRLHSKLRREVDRIKICVDNILINIKDLHNKKILSLAEYDEDNPQIKELLTSKREEIKYMKFNMVEKRSAIKKAIENEKETFFRKRDNSAEKMLLLHKEKCKEDLERVNEQYFMEIEDGNQLEKQEQKFNDFCQMISDHYDERKKKANEINFERSLMLKEFYKIRGTIMKLDAEKHWKRYRQTVQEFIDNSEFCATNYLNRVINHEDLMIRSYKDYLDKVGVLRKQIRECLQRIRSEEKLEEEVNREMKILRTRAAGTRSTLKQVRFFQNELSKINQEKTILIKRTRQLKVKYRNYKDETKKYFDVLKVINAENDVKINNSEIDFNLQGVLDTIYRQVVGRMRELFASMKLTDKEKAMRSLLHYIRSVGSLQYEVTKSSKIHDDLVDFIEKFIQDMDFSNRIPFKKIDRIHFRKVPIYQFSKISCKIGSNTN